MLQPATLTSESVYVIRRQTVRKLGYFAVLIIALCCAGGLALLLYLFMPFAWTGEPILAAQESMHGLQMQVIQRYTGDPAKPFVVGFFYKPRGGRWYFHHLDHDALYWRPRIDVDQGGLATIFNYGQIVAQLHFDEADNYTFSYACGAGRGATIHGHPKEFLSVGDPLDGNPWARMESGE